jgi:CrcB protein
MFPVSPRAAARAAADENQAVVERLPADSDVDLHVPLQRAELRRAPWAVLGAISGGGALGASARYAFGVAFPAGPTGFPWATFGVNVLGCLLIGVLMVCVIHLWPQRLLLRPFVGVGVLGGFTTFSTYVVEIQNLLDAGAAVTALAYLAGTVAAAVPATWLGLAATRRLLRRFRPVTAAEVGR